MNLHKPKFHYADFHQNFPTGKSWTQITNVADTRHLDMGGAENVRLENAELENPAPNHRGGKRGTGKPGTKSQGWKTRDWKTRHQLTGVENTGPENGGTSKLWKAVAVENVQHS